MPDPSQSPDVVTMLARLEERMLTVMNTTKRIEGRLDRDFVTRAEFEPVRKVLWMVGSAFGIAVVVAVAKLVIIT